MKDYTFKAVLTRDQDGSPTLWKLDATPIKDVRGNWYGGDSYLTRWENLPMKNPRKGGRCLVQVVFSRTFGKYPVLFHRRDEGQLFEHTLGLCPTDLCPKLGIRKGRTAEGFLSFIPVTS